MASAGASNAANALSDVYAMGGKPFLALNIAALPDNLPAEISSEILRGGAEKAREIRYRKGVLLSNAGRAEEAAAEFSKDEYRVDILKLEFPGDLKFSRQFAAGAFDGKERPAVSGSNEDAWAQNRRGVTMVTGGAPSS